MSQVSWLQFIPTLMTFVFLVAALVYAIAQRSDGSQARKMAIFGLSILIAMRVCSLIANVLIVRFAVSDYLLYHGLYSIVSALLYMLGMSMLIAAVFFRRHAPGDSTSGEERMQRSGYIHFITRIRHLQQPVVQHLEVDCADGEAVHDQLGPVVDYQ